MRKALIRKPTKTDLKKPAHYDVAIEFVTPNF